MHLHRRALVVAAATAISLLAAAPPSYAAPGGNSGQCRKSCLPAADSTAPVVAFSAPTTGTTVSGTVTLTGSASDAAGLARVDTSVDGGAWSTAAGTTSWTGTLDTAAYANGPHTVSARATDSSGNVAVTSVSISVSNSTPDTTAPMVTVVSPAAGSTVAGSVSVTGAASDDLGLARVEVSVDSGSWALATGTGSWSWSWSTTSIANGSHTLAARAIDTSGNITTTPLTSFTVSNPTATTAPNSQGSWVSPEGVQLNVSTAGPWTISKVYSILTANALDLDKLGPTLTVNVQDTVASSTTTSVTLSGGRYTGWKATIYLKGINSTFAVGPDDIETHEYGHAWASYWRYAAQAGSWGVFQRARWTVADGSVTLANDSRTDSSYTWSTDEIMADDYRYLFGTAAAVSQRAHLNTTLPDPRTVPFLRETLLGAWRGL